MPREVVTISLADFENRKQEIAEQLHAAAKDVGFFYIAGARREAPPQLMPSPPARRRLQPPSSAIAIPLAVPRRIHGPSFASFVCDTGH